MADSQPADSSKIFSLRIVSIDHYMSPPIPGVDICYSSFQGGKVNEVPVIRVYGSTPAGQKTCLHVHRAFPYLYVPCLDIPINGNREGDAYTHAISLALEKALKLKGNVGSKRQHVHGCSLVRAKKFYGYHSDEELFVKIYLYYPHDVSRAANLLLSGAVFDKSLQPHESHIPFILQFLVDYNLYGMGHLHLSKMKFRNPVPDCFTPRKFSNQRQDGPEMDESTCISADFQIQVVVSVWFPQFGSHLLFLAVGCGNFPVNSMFHQTKTCNVVNVKAFVTLREMPPLMIFLISKVKCIHPSHKHVQM